VNSHEEAGGNLIGLGAPFELGGGHGSVSVSLKQRRAVGEHIQAGRGEMELGGAPGVQPSTSNTGQRCRAHMGLLTTRNISLADSRDQIRRGDPALSCNLHHRRGVFTSALSNQSSHYLFDAPHRCTESSQPPVQPSVKVHPVCKNGIVQYSATRQRPGEEQVALPPPAQGQSSGGGHPYFLSLTLVRDV
jgi:hypothetical protein